jgi:hypothetical protein
MIVNGLIDGSYVYDSIIKVSAPLTRDYESLYGFYDCLGSSPCWVIEILKFFCK